MFQRITGILSAMVLLAVVAMPVLIAAQEKAATEPESSPAASGATDNGTATSSRPAVVVREFSVSQKTSWPYETKQLQSQLVAELNAKTTGRADVTVGVPATAHRHTYILEGEIVSWRSGNAAKRMLVGMGSGRESADIHYWLTDEQGKKVFEHKDTIRAEFWGNAYSGSVGQLAHPFASKIAARLADAKLF